MVFKIMIRRQNMEKYVFGSGVTVIAKGIAENHKVTSVDVSKTGINREGKRWKSIECRCQGNLRNS
jgi:hypothetical protein